MQNVYKMLLMLMPATRPRTKQKTLLFAKSGAEIPDWEEPVERLVQALEQDEFELYAQRIVALDKPKAAPMAEVLLRMREDAQGLLPPGSFLPVFERCGMMPELGRAICQRRPQDRLPPHHRRLRLQPRLARAAPGVEAELRQGGPRRDPQSAQPDGARQAGQDRARRQEARRRRDRRVRGKRR